MARFHWTDSLSPFVCLLIAGLVPHGMRSQAQESLNTNESLVAPQGTLPLTTEGDLASLMIDGIDAFLLKQTARASETRQDYWHLDTTNWEAFKSSVAPNRQRLIEMLGVQASRVADATPTLIAMPGESGIVAECDSFVIFALRWPVLPDPAPATAQLTSVWGEGLLLVPTGEILADVVAIPDADHSPEQLCGLEPGIPVASQFAASLAASGCRVVVPTLVSRHRQPRGGRATLTDREYIQRSAFELGRTLPGYEVQKILAAVDWLADSGGGRPLGGIGYGEGGQHILFAAAIDERLQATAVSGFGDSRDAMWSEPVDRNLFGFVREFDTHELGLLVAPRHLALETSRGPIVDIPGDGGAGKLNEVHAAGVQRTARELSLLVTPLANEKLMRIEVAGPQTDVGRAMFCSPELLAVFLSQLLDGQLKAEAIATAPRLWAVESKVARQERIERRRETQLAELDRHNQLLLRESPHVRAQYMSELDYSSVEAFDASSAVYRKRFGSEVIGEFAEPLLPMRAQSRATWETDKWTGYEIALDVFPEVFAYGVLLLPKDMQPGERRPVVVCQHGLEGRPTDTFLGDHAAYHDFAAELCERGFITFAPQNPYIFRDRFRSLQRKAQPLGCSLFSIIVPQHQQIVNWLKSQPFVDSERIAFYGLSYGGKSAMRIPALVTDYCLSICSADFNEWVLKNASTRDKFSYVWTGEYEIFEWDLGSTFNYAEMAALICPRPFMVERGHFDGVGVDEWVAYEYAKVRHLYAARLGIGERTEIEWFVGPHTIHGQGTFDFLHQHLRWPK